MIISKIDCVLKQRKIEDLVDVPVVVKVHGSFDSGTLNSFKESLEKAEENDIQDEILISINSYGGYVYDLLAMVDLLKQCKKPIYTLCHGKAMSCGAALFSFGQKRYMTDYSVMMIHDVSNASSGKTEEMKADAKETERLNLLVHQMMSENIGKDPDYIWNEIHKRGRADWFLTPEEAKQHNLVTHIGYPKYNISVDTSCKLML